MMITKALVLPLVLFSVARCQDFVSSRYEEEGFICDVSERMEKKCSFEVKKVRSIFECLASCGTNNLCIGASLDGNGMCIHHKECRLISGCTDQNNAHKYVSKYCKHGGVWDQATRSCKCAFSFFGDRCEKCHKKCRDLIQAGFIKGFYDVYLDPDHGGERPIPVTCYINPSTDYSMLVILTNRGEMSFNKTWDEYVHGFYYDENHFWAGLDAWHRFSNNGCNEMIFVFWKDFDAAVRMYRDYFDFHVADENSRYSFTFNSSTEHTNVPGATFGDCLGPIQNVPFSTWDADNDGDPNENCAKRAGSGWWYNGCDNPCNAFGFGFQHWHEKPSYQLFSVLGSDLNQWTSEPGMFKIQLLC